LQEWRFKACHEIACVLKPGGLAPIYSPKHMLEYKNG
jgi:hypothetical protein